MEKIPFGFGGTILRPCMVPQLPFAKWWHEFSSVEVVQQEFSGLIDFSTNRIPCCLKLPNWWNILNHDLLTDVILTKFCPKIFRIPTKNIFLYLTIRPAQLLQGDPPWKTFEVQNCKDMENTLKIKVIRKSILFCKYLHNESSELHETLYGGQLLSCKLKFLISWRSINKCARMIPKRAHSQ